MDFLESGVLQTNFGSDFEKKLGKLLYTGKVGVLDGNVNLLDEEEEEMGDEETKELDRFFGGNGWHFWIPFFADAFQFFPPQFYCWKCKCLLADFPSKIGLERPIWPSNNSIRKMQSN